MNSSPTKDPASTSSMQSGERWNTASGAEETPSDGYDFGNELLELTREERAMLDQFSSEDRRFRELDSALSDAMQLMRMSDARVHNLRKMHAMVLLQQVKQALDGYHRAGGDGDAVAWPHERMGLDYGHSSSSDDEDEGTRLLGSRRSSMGRTRGGSPEKRGPDSDAFSSMRRTASSNTLIRARQPLGFVYKEGVLDDEEDDDPWGTPYEAEPFWVDSGVLAPPAAEDADAPEATLPGGSGDSGGTSEPAEAEDGGEARADGADAAATPRPEAEWGPERFARRYQRRTRLNRLGASVFAAWAVCCIAYLILRVAKTLAGLGGYLPYGVFVLFVEVLGATATGIYGLNLIWTPINPELERRKPPPSSSADAESVQPDSNCQSPAGSVSNGGGGDVEMGRASSDKEPAAGDEEPPYEPLVTGAYHIRVLIPCYKEPADIVRKTVEAIRAAALPEGCYRTIYLCDDGANDRKAWPECKEKRRMCERAGRDVKYVAGRDRSPNEMNGKSGNLNNACRQIYPDGCDVPPGEVICVMDADQVANPDFLLRLIPLLDGGDDVGMVLSPQCFSNLNQEGDIFNHSNIHFWEYMQPGYDALGFISCTGTNFLIRSKAFQECGWSPEYTLTEDFALGMELKMRHWQCRYVCEYLAIGDAPDQIRNCFQQRSRWCKGHFQAVFSKAHCPLLKKKLSVFMRILFCSGVWSYIVASIATPTFILVPVLTIWFGIFPIVLSWWAALGLTVYYVATTSVLMFVRDRNHVKPLWFSNVSTFIMFWTYWKAFLNTQFGKIIGKSISFKTTIKGAGRLKADALMDLLVPVGLFVLCAVSFGIGVKEVARCALGVKTTLLVSLAWLVFNMIPGYLLLHYALGGRGTTLKIACRLAFAVSIFVNLLALAFIWMLYPRGIDYGGAMTATLTYLQSSMPQPLPGAGFGVPWRAPAFAQDAASPLVAPATGLLSGSHDSSGDWMTGGAGGNLKMTQPIAFTTAMLAWSLLSFPGGFTSGTKAATLQQIQVGADYLKKTLMTHTPGNPDFYIIYQVGNISTESRYWGHPEAYTGTRPSFYVNASSGSSDLTGALAAAFAASSLALKRANPQYSQQLLGLAADMYKAAKTYPGWYMGGIQGGPCYTVYQRANLNTRDPYGELAVARSVACLGPADAYNGSAAAWYNSTTYHDDMMWAATWLYDATRQPSYLNDAINYYVDHTQGRESQFTDQLLFNWRNTFWGANLKLAQLQGNAAYHRQMQHFFKYWLCGTGSNPVKVTPLGRAWNANDGSLGTTANAAFLAAVYAQVTTRSHAKKSKRYVCFAREQTRYMLGASSASYLVGFGKKYSEFPQVMGASCPGLPFPGKQKACGRPQALSKAPNPHVAVGALLEQSSFTDDISAVRGSNSSRTAIEFDAGLLGVLAGVRQAPGEWDECLQGNGVLSRDHVICLASS